MTTVAQPSLVNVSALAPLAGGPLATLAAALGASGPDQGRGDFAAVLAQTASAGGAAQPAQPSSALTLTSGRNPTAASAVKSGAANVSKAESSSILTPDQSDPSGTAPDPASVLLAASANVAVAGSAANRSAATPAASALDFDLHNVPADVTLAVGAVDAKASDLVQGSSSAAADAAPKVAKTNVQPTPVAVLPGKTKALPQARVNAPVSSGPSGGLNGLVGAGHPAPEPGSGGDDQPTAIASPSDLTDSKAAPEKAKAEPLTVATGAEAAAIPLPAQPLLVGAQTSAPASRSGDVAEASNISQKPPVAVQGLAVATEALEVPVPTLTKAASEAVTPAAPTYLAADPAEVSPAPVPAVAASAPDLKASAPSSKSKAAVTQVASSAPNAKAVQTPAPPVASDTQANAALDAPAARGGPSR
jgi:hypothetical protein